MASRRDLDLCYIACARSHAVLSKATRKKVGACIVTKTGILIPGFNGTVPGQPNSCEIDGATAPGVLHAELNAILKAAREGVSIVGSTLYVTLSPCQQCAAMIAAAGITRVVWEELYRDDTGLRRLVEDYHIECQNISEIFV